MKTVKQSFTKTIRVSSVEKEDLECIESLLIKLNPQDLVIELPGYELTSVSELQELKGKPIISRIKYRMHRPEYVTITIDKYGVDMYTADGENIAVKGVFSDIEKRLKNSFSYVVSLLGYIFAYFGSILLVVSVGLAMINQARGVEYHADRAIVLIFTALLLVIFGLGARQFTRFRLNPYEKVPNFFKRHADAMILSGISLVISGVIAYIVTILAK